MLCLAGLLLPCAISYAFVRRQSRGWGDEQEADLKKGAYQEMMQEVMRRTAALVAAWQSVGFVHGASPAHLTTTSYEE